MDTTRPTDTLVGVGGEAGDGLAGHRGVRDHDPPGDGRQQQVGVLVSRRARTSVSWRVRVPVKVGTIPSAGMPGAHRRAWSIVSSSDGNAR